MSSLKPKKQASNGNSHGGSKLTAYECPACHMWSWYPGQSEEDVYCPFCFSGLPAYITKILPEKMIARDDKTEEEDQSPFVLEFHMVQGTGFRCMAYCNGEGKWQRAFDNVVLPGEVRVLE